MYTSVAWKCKEHEMSTTHYDDATDIKDACMQT